ncbi:MAG: DUF5682 family protein [Nibricoccus sp.]
MPLSEIDAEINGLGQSLWQPEIIYFPVRHHSPACSAQLERLIQSVRPRAILVEGPTSFEPLLPVLLDHRTRPPVAFYTTFIDQHRRTERSKGEQPDFTEARFAAYYPFAEYSPEWVALKAGAVIGSKLGFIDLDFAAQILATKQNAERVESVRAQALLHERQLTRSRYLKALAVKSGCRDFDELWDHLFEAQADRIDSREFVLRLATYCLMARREATPEEFEADATAARERWMAYCIHRALTAPKGEKTGPVLVVTGGYHTVALPTLVEACDGKIEGIPEFGSDEVQHYVIRYSFQQLDALNGYNSGMPSPSYYQRIWDRRFENAEKRWDDAAAGILVDVGRHTRRRKLATAISSADAIAAFHQAQLLSRMRGHPGPMREDVLDGMRGCFCKGGIADEGALILAAARELMAGQAIGEIPPDTSVPPILADFRRTADDLRLGGNDGSKRKVGLELYRKVKHRKVSRFLHCLEFINVPFGRLVAGPDFVRGTDVGRLIEHWECAWTPRTDSGLIDAAIYGATVVEAALARLKESVQKLSAEGKGRSASAAVEMLVRACRMGLHAHCGELTEVIRISLSEDPSFVSVVRAAEQFVLLWQAREPLEAHNLPQLPGLVQAALMRASSLIPTLTTCPANERDQTLQALVAMRSLLTTIGDLVDADIYWNGLIRLRAEPACEPIISGAALGLLFGSGRVNAAMLAQEGAGYLNAVGVDWSRRIEFLRGLLRACREVAWQCAEVLEAVDKLLGGWSEEEFVKALPELRLAFADLTPKETDKVGCAVAGLHGETSIGDLLNRDLSQAEFEQNRLLTLAVLSQLREDGLADWNRTEDGV